MSTPSDITCLKENHYAHSCFNTVKVMWNQSKEDLMNYEDPVDTVDETQDCINEEIEVEEQEEDEEATIETQ